MSNDFSQFQVKRVEKLRREKQLDLIFDLINAFRIVKTPLESTLFIQDILTASEIKNLSKRLRIAKLILARKSQREIANDLHCSFATIAKIRVWLDQKGEGLKNVISKLPKRYKIPKNLPSGPIEYHLPQTLVALAEYSMARKQEKMLETSLKEIKDKKLIDKELIKIFSEDFKTAYKKKKYSIK